MLYKYKIKYKDTLKTETYNPSDLGDLRDVYDSFISDSRTAFYNDLRQREHQIRFRLPITRDARDFFLGKIVDP